MAKQCSPSDRKAVITQYIADAAEVPVAVAFKQSWTNHHPEKRLRLTSWGFSYLAEEIEFYTHKLARNLTSKEHIGLVDAFDSPWFYKEKVLYIFDEDVNMMLVLSNGNIAAITGRV